jgi:Zn-dependent protease with chaperone function
MSTSEAAGAAGTKVVESHQPLGTPDGQNGTNLTATELLAPFDKAIEPIRVDPLYRLGLLFVMVAMILLPLIYLSLIAAMAYGVWYHMTQNTFILEGGGGRGSGRGRLLAYLGPLVMGCVGIVFMIKPLFAPRAKPTPRHSLDPKDQPLLFQFVERLCRTVRAPIPRRIDVDTQVNASASFRRGVLSFLGNDLVLTIGLPLVEGMSLRQLTGVLAHEFGHFAQGSGMRLTYVVRSINGWFARVVYERDAWDEKLAESVAQSGGWIKGMLWLTQGFVWLARRVLWVLMWVGHVVSCFMLRQMEYDADRYEARVAGSETFARTADQLVVLSIANQGAHQDLQQSWQANRLADDLPKLVMANVEQLQERADVLEKVRKDILMAKTGPIDTHPSNRDRIASAEKEAAPGIFQLEPPAKVIFLDFDRVSRETTLNYYREIIGEQVGADQLIPTNLLVREQTEILGGQKTLFRYFQGELLGMYHLFPGEARLEAPQDIAQATFGLTSARAKMLEELPVARTATETFLACAEKSRVAARVAELMRAGIRTDGSAFKLNDAGHQGARAADDAATAERQAALRDLDAKAQPARERLFAALSALRLGAVADRLPPGYSSVERCERLLTTLGALARAYPAMESLHHDLDLLAVLFNHIEGREESAALSTEIRNQLARVRTRIVSVRTALASAEYPFEHGRGSVSIADHLATDVPNAEEAGDLFSTAQAVIGKFDALYFRAMSVLATVAEQVETAVGLPLLPDPPTTKESSDLAETESSA